MFQRDTQGDTYSLQVGPVSIKYPVEKRVFTLAEIGQSLDQAVDNTGNMRVWPSEEILTAYLLDSPLLPEILAGSVIELGAGKSGLIAFTLAKLNCPKVVVSDGNAQCV